jgi:hypothetical protein
VNLKALEMKGQDAWQSAQAMAHTVLSIGITADLAALVHRLILFIRRVATVCGYIILSVGVILSNRHESQKGASKGTLFLFIEIGRGFG